MSDEHVHATDDDATGAGSDWLWDRSGAPDPDVERLESLLAPLGAPALPGGRRPAATRAAWVPWAAAAALLLALGAGWAWQARDGSPPAAGEVAVVADGGQRLAPGAWIEARDAQREVRFGDWGRVTLEPGARLRVAQARRDVTRFYLERGRLEAFVSAEARPRFFQVDTRATRCVDLGCRYTLDVDGEGVSHVRVSTGQVAFEDGAREVYVPAGAACTARPGRGADTPLFEDAPEALVRAARAYDEAGPAERVACARTLLAAVRSPRDALAAVHLLGDPAPAIAAAAAAALRERFGAPAEGEGRDAWRLHLERLW